MTQQRYRDLAEWPLMGTALVFLAAYAWQVIGRVEESTAAAADSVEEPLRAELAGLVTEIAALRREVAELKDRPTL